MSLYDWLLFLHVAAAFALVSAFVVFSVLIVAGWRTESARDALVLSRLARPATVLVGAGSVLTLALGIWLAIYLDAYQVWDGWILASIALWVIAVATGSFGGRDYAKAQDVARQVVDGGGEAATPELRGLLRSRRALLLNVGSTIATLAILVLMIYKPGA